MAFNADASFTYYSKDASELVLRPAIERPALSDIFAIREGIKGKLLVRYMERVGLITVKDPGCIATGGPLPIGRTSKQWNPVDLLASVVECWKDARGTAEEWALNAGNDKYILDDTTYGLAYADLISSAVFEDLQRMAHFADSNILAAKLTASVTLSNGTVVTAAQLVPFFKTFDGLWRNVEKGIAAGKTKLVPVPQNDPNTTQVFGPADAYPLMLKVVEGAGSRLRAIPLAQKQLLVTRSIADAYLSNREASGFDSGYNAQMNGIPQLMFRGIPITIVDEWDEFIGAYFKTVTGANPARPDRPHRILFTGKGNLQLGFDATPVTDIGGADLEIWSERKDRTWNARQQYVADQQIADDSLVVAAY